MTQKHVDMCKKYNIEFISHYGSVDTIPLLVNYIDGNSEYTRLSRSRSRRFL